MNNVDIKADNYFSIIELIFLTVSLVVSFPPCFRIFCLFKNQYDKVVKRRSECRLYKLTKKVEGSSCSGFRLAALQSEWPANFFQFPFLNFEADVFRAFGLFS